jgi:hypothetical protein
MSEISSAAMVCWADQPGVSLAIGYRLTWSYVWENRDFPPSKSVSIITVDSPPIRRPCKAAAARDSTKLR